MRPTRVRLDATTRRAQIVEQASGLIARSGYNATSLADIAAACNVRKSTILHHFPSMADLLKAVLLQRDAADYIAIGACPGGGDRREVRAYLDAAVARNLQQPELLRLYVMLGAEALAPAHPAHGYFIERHCLAVKTLAGLLAWKDDPGAAALELLAFWQGLETVWLRDPTIDFRAVWSRFGELFFA
ncbi:hypothetical protein XB05_08650 [Xanthomonas arboricola]|uniref:TetR/AcrR family transcriptional regulator n=1 Tax=Xanthomonas arboricola TaxID=56448 RepID=UPI00061A3E4F|nr:TetR/AcrR family transcriptional regulator [Xanthomonas arboricola]AKC78786.1 hypothetical protein XB05_08650 [Xanthomonas arboricola]